MLNLAEIGCGAVTQNLARKVKIRNVPLTKCNEECLSPAKSSLTATPLKRMPVNYHQPDFLIRPCQIEDEHLIAKTADGSNLKTNDAIKDFSFKRISPEFFDLLRRHEPKNKKARFKKVKRSDVICIQETLHPNDLEITHPNLAAHMAQTMEHGPVSNYIYDINFYDEAIKRRAYQQSHLDLNYILYAMDILNSNIRALTVEELDDIKWFLASRDSADLDPRIFADILRLLKKKYPSDPFFAKYLNQALERLKPIGNYISEYFQFNKYRRDDERYGRSRFGRVSYYNSRRPMTSDSHRKLMTRPSMSNLASYLAFRPVLYHEPFSADKVETWHALSTTTKNRLTPVTEKKVDLGRSRSFLLKITPYDRRPSFGGPLLSRPSVVFDPSFASYRQSISPDFKTASQFAHRYSETPYEHRRLSMAPR